MQAEQGDSASRPGSTCGVLLAAGVWLGWFGLAALLATGLASLLATWLPAWLNTWARLALLAGLLLLPVLGGLRLARRPGWERLTPLGLALLAVTSYALADILARAIAGEDRELLIDLQLAGLMPLAIAIGWAVLRAARIPPLVMLARAGLKTPSLAGLALGGGLVGLLSLGWPLTGALGDRLASLSLLLATLASTLPEEILFRGVIWGTLSQSYPRRRGLATTLSLLIYLVFIPTQMLPAGDWEALGMIAVLVPLALLTTQLRALTGSIWAGTLAAWLLRAMPLLFTDPRDEILEPSQWLAGGAMLAGAALVALLVWIGRRVVVSARHWPKLLILAATLLLAVSAWAVWMGGWVWAGEPGFHNDGFLILMQEQADLSAAYTMADPLARRAYVYQQLVATAEASQAPVRAKLDALGWTYQPYYLINMIRVEGHHGKREEFADLPGVASVLVNPNVRPYPRHTPLGTFPAPSGGGVEWNIQRTGADQVWAMGYRGQGVVVGGQDTGYDWEHPALQRSYRGWDANTGQVDHDYNWHDAWDDTRVPHDDGDHGTHTMGIIVGDDGQGNQIGMAPAARWIGCRNMRRGIGNPASYTECMEFFLAPYPPDGDPFRNGDVSRAPDVVNNSWGCPDYEGCQPDTLQPALHALRAAGMMMVVSAGNQGPACQTITDPPAPYAAVLSVGASDASGTVTFFSSRGPAMAADQGEPLLKPDLVAPGDMIRSSVPGGGYASASGTSMAGPHVTGLVALLWSARPDLRGNIEATQEIIRRSARPVPVAAICPNAPQPAASGLLAQLLAAAKPQVCACGGVIGTPNNVYGWGEMDALRAVEMALEGQ